MARSIPVADQAIAEAALSKLDEIYNEAGLVDTMTYPLFMLECASRVRFQPSTRQLVLTFDLDMSSDQSTGGTVTPIQ